ncbi:hypothetical protein AB0M48_16555 [Lentzea sp. NPDC051208]|uniref:hypothetical protein n=1 Tax=Lentzea sp. NPDC051208 TaxID=3154642 RepID=UPI003439B8C5
MQPHTARAIGKLTASAVAAAMASLPGRASAAPHYRAHGPLLTDGYQTWIDAINNQGANLAKVVTGWDMPGSGPWQNFPDHVWTAAGATRQRAEHPRRRPLGTRTPGTPTRTSSTPSGSATSWARRRPANPSPR